MAARRRLLLSRRSGLMVRVVDEEVFLLDPKRRSIHHLNRISLAVWRLLARPHDIRGIVRLLAVAFPDTAVADIRHDVRALIGNMIEEGLVKRRTAAARVRKRQMRKTRP